MRVSGNFASVAALLLVCSPLFAATPAQIPITRHPVNTQHPNAHPRQEPCWEQAGVSKAAMSQRRSLQESARAQVQSVCANSALTLQQRRQEIHAIHERTRQQVDTLITPQQREAIRSCQEARAGSHPGGGHGIHTGGGGHEGGPCGEVPEAKEPANEREP